ncbi:hypothetical protein EBZ80_25240 [bacterium]|nr:hypothetical protein [bacterium]
MLTLDKSFRDEINVAIALNQFQYFMSEGRLQAARGLLEGFRNANPNLANHPRLVEALASSERN